jgi:hypothetical protein
MREAIAEYVEREERREQFWADAEAAWAEFEEIGLHATQDSSCRNSRPARTRACRCAIAGVVAARLAAIASSRIFGTNEP